MNRPPEPPPEGVLIEKARREARLSVREAARRAGISEGWWRQVVKGYQNLSGGAYGTVRGVPAETVAKMARAARVAPDALAAEGQRPDAARILAEIRRDDPAPGTAPRDLPALLPPASSGDVDLAQMIPMPEEVREAARPYAEKFHRLYIEAVARTGDTDPAGDEVFPAGSWDAQSWDRLRRLMPPLRRLGVIAVLNVPGEVPSGRQHGAAAGLTPLAALSRSGGA